MQQGEWLPCVLHDTIIASKTKWWGLFPRRISKPHTFFYVKTLFVPAIAFFMGKMLMYMPLLTGGVKEMPAQEQER